MDKKPITVMHLIADLDYAGAQEVVRLLVKHLQSDEVRPLVCTFRDGPLREAIESLGVPVHVLGARQHRAVNLPGFFSDIRRIKAELRDIVRRSSVDVVQTHLLGLLDLVVVSLRKSESSLRVLLTLHSVEFLPRATDSMLGIRSFARRLLFKRIGRGCDGLIAVSKEVAAAVSDRMPALSDKVTIIQNGVDVTRFEGGTGSGLAEIEGVSEDDIIIAVVGRLGVEKGHRYLIEAARHVCQRHPHTRFLLIGDGELRAPLVDMTKKANLSAHILFLGLRSDIPHILGSARLFALPSLWEGLSIALLEAMAAGLPVVASRVSGTNEVMIDGVTGLLVPAKNSKALAEAICELIEDPQRAAEMGMAGKRRVVSDFSAEKQALEHIDLYRRVL